MDFYGVIKKTSAIERYLSKLFPTASPNKNFAYTKLPKELAELKKLYRFETAKLQLITEDTLNIPYRRQVLINMGKLLQLCIGEGEGARIYPIKRFEAVGLSERTSIEVIGYAPYWLIELIPSNTIEVFSVQLSNQCVIIGEVVQDSWYQQYKITAITYRDGQEYVTLRRLDTEETVKEELVAGKVSLHEELTSRKISSPVDRCGNASPQDKHRSA
jgi:hypothetical protein